MPPHRLGPNDDDLCVVLDHVMAGDPLAGAAYASGLEDPRAPALRSFCLSMAHRWRDARFAAERALQDTRDPGAHWMARGAAAFSAAGWPVRPGRDAVDHVARGLAGAAEVLRLQGPARALAGHWLVEGAFAQNDIAAAMHLASVLGPPDPALLPDELGPHAYVSLMHATHARVLAFTGDVSAAATYLDSLPRARAPLGRLVIEACTSVIQGAAGQEGVHGLADRLEARPESPRDHVTSGVHLLVAYGLMAMGETARAARFVLRAGAGPGLEDLTIVDRALGLDVLVRAALDEGDVDAAEAWAAEAAELRESPIGDSAAARTQARLDLAAGRLDEAERWARRSREAAARGERAMEVMEAELLLSAVSLARARPGDAQRRLQAMVDTADASGFGAARKAANRELRRSGRRLDPPRGGGWSVLSAREQSVALLMGRGLGNAEIAARLSISEHTVRLHASRVLAAYGIASRTPLAAALADRLPPVPGGLLPTLTRRQRDVAERVAVGQRNAEIAHALGIREGTVEQHVGNILRKWRISSRTEIAAVMAGRRAKPTGE